MNFIGLGFYSDEDSLNFMPTYLKPVKSTTLVNGIYDDFYVSNDVSVYDKASIAPSFWDTFTVLHAEFNGNLSAGNVSFTADNITGLRLKRRKVGTNTWVFVKQWKTANVEDLNFIVYDKYNLAKTDYEYGIAPLMGDIEGNLSVVKVKSDFDGLYITDPFKMIGTPFDIELGSFKKSNETSVIKPMNNIYPYVIKNGSSNFYSATFKAMFAKYDSISDTIDYENSINYREDIMNWLLNNHAKLIKYDDGRGWLVDITDDIDLSENGHPDKVDITIPWVQIGNHESNDNLFENGMITIE